MMTSREHVEEIARICHEVNRAYCEGIGDKSQLPWEEAPEWQKESAKNGVIFHLNSDKTPRESHENWLKDKKADGWIYGDVKDVEKKTHPCMVPYDELPSEQKIKDSLFTAICNCFK